MRIQLNLQSVRDYETFLKVKQLPAYRFTGRTAEFADHYAERLGIVPAVSVEREYNPPAWMFDYQRDICRMALSKTKYSVFADCGLGKTPILLEFARETHARTGGKVLIVSPLMVVSQTCGEAERFFGDSLPIVRLAANQLADWLASDAVGVAITNYDAITDDLPDCELAGLILDESSMLKSHYGAWGTRLIAMGRGVPYKLALTGTPAPNDRIEYANHAVFMDAYPTVNSFLARFFVNRGETSERWELKPHALRPFYVALSHWCIFLTNPATYGWRDNCGTLPPIHVHIHDVPSTDEQRDAIMQSEGTLFVANAGGIGSRGRIARIGKGIHDGKKIDSNKTRYVASLVASWPMEQTIVWCKYNAEQDEVAAALPGCGNMDGSTPYEERMILIEWFCGRICTCERQRRIGNICGRTTRPTNNDGPNDPLPSSESTTPNDEQSTLLIPQRGTRRGGKLKSGKSGIQTSDSPSGSRSTGSRQTSTAGCSLSSAGNARSATNRTRDEGDCTSTTTTTPEGSVGCSASTATTESASSTTTQNDSNAQHCTCGGISNGRVLVSKPRLLGFGLNLQCATRQVFAGLQDSYEEFYQAVKRSNRYGSTRALNVHIPITEFEAPMVDTVLSKSRRVESDTKEQETLFREFAYRF